VVKCPWAPLFSGHFLIGGTLGPKGFLGTIVSTWPMGFFPFLWAQPNWLCPRGPHLDSCNPFFLSPGTNIQRTRYIHLEARFKLVAQISIGPHGGGWLSTSPLCVGLPPQGLMTIHREFSRRFVSKTRLNLAKAIPLRGKNTIFGGHPSGLQGKRVI